MGWIEVESGIKFLDWDEYKEGHSSKDAIVVKDGDKIEAIVTRIDTVLDKDGEITDYKFRLSIKGEDKPVLLWANAAMKRQQEELNIVEGEEIRLHYDGTYPTDKGNSGRNVRISVNRK